MHYLLIACDVFEEVIYKNINHTSSVITPVYLKLEAHLEPLKLRREIQQIIDDAEGQSYDMILLAYGLCGNATENIVARSIPIVIPKAHDCCTLFLGSIENFMKHFSDNLSAQWTCSSYLSKSNQGMYSVDAQSTMNYLGLSTEFKELVEQYGEDNAQYLWDMLHKNDRYNSKMFYINTESPDDQKNVEELKKISKEEDKELYLLTGDLRLIDGLFNKHWNEEYLIVSPGESIMSTNDLHTVLAVKKR